MRASSIKVKKPPATAADAVSIRGARDLQAQSEQAAKLLKALANPDRLLLLCQLVEQEKSVAELGELTGIAQPSLSQQLSVLRTENLVATRREGKSMRLVLGGILFGVGWGIAGYCPGPGIVAASTGSLAGGMFVVAMLVGMTIHDRLIAKA